MIEALNYPFDANNILRKKRSIRRHLISQSDLIEKRIAILGGSTTAEIKDMLELFLLKDGFKPVFYESEYNRYYEDIMFPNSQLKDFAPEVIYIHTSNVNLSQYPGFQHSEKDIEKIITNEVDRFTSVWDRITEEYSCPIVQNNFEQPHYRSLGNLDGYDIHGRSNFVSELNMRFNQQARYRQNLYLNDINYLSAWFGLERWYDKSLWYSYKYAMSYVAIPLLAHSVASIIKAVFGNVKKCLVLDLDNTLWGGVIGDDGLNGIVIGKETPQAEAYTDFQKYVKGLKERGIILAVCSKNDEVNAREGFNHPDSILSIGDFSAFRANWQPKHENIREIARSLNISVDSLVFVDDNPAERDIVRRQEPQVSVPEVGDNVENFINLLDKSSLFETVSLSKDDLNRSLFYAENVQRQNIQSHFNSYNEFLSSLEMVAEIKPFASIYLDRITQLINKTNQFNVTTRRYTFAEIEAIANDENYIALYGRLQDKFGDNGLVSIMIGAVRGNELHVDLWLMSCRVLKREMEAVMLDRLVEEAKAKGLSAIIGYYYPTKKNGMVNQLFKEMGFQHVESKASGDSVWKMTLTDDYITKNSIIKIIK